MAEFVGNDATQNYRDLEFGIVTPGATHCVVVIDAGEYRVDSKTEDTVLENVRIYWAGCGTRV
jgi:hypothetical protein